MTGRITAAFFFAPLVTALLYSLISLWTVGFSGGLSEFLATALVVYIFAASGTVTLTLPAFVLLNRFNLVRWWSALGAGALLGVLYTFLIGSDSFSSPVLRGRLPLAFLGAVSGLAFWLIWRKVTPPNNRWRGRESR